MSCSPQRYFANNRNLIASAAALAPSSVQSVEDSVLELPVSRDGSAQVAMTGTYTGTEAATYDFRIDDTTVSTILASEPVSTGAGSGVLSGIAATGLPAQTFTVSMIDAGVQLLAAAVDVEGVRIKARTPGAAGNLLRITVDQSAIVHTPQSFSLLEELAKGAGSATSGVEGPAYDWDTQVIGSDGQIPTSAHRVSFGDDHAAIYLQYKEYKDGKWTYHFIPEIQHTVPKGARVNFVTGGRTVVVSDGTTPEPDITGVVTLYDFLVGLADSDYVVVDGVIANDRSVTGQAAHEFLTRTDAHVEPSSGEGSDAATGFINTSAESTAATELVTATCYAVTPADHPLAHVGASRWKLQGSVSGDLGDIVEGVPYALAGKFALTIPQKLPNGYGTPKGSFSFSYRPVGRPGTDEPPPVCVIGALGAAAEDKSLTLRWTKRPSGDCLCDDMPKPSFSAFCLGIDVGGVGDMGYQADTVTKLIALYQWKSDTTEKLTNLAEGSEASLVRKDSSVDTPLESLNTLVSDFHNVLVQLDTAATSPTDYRAAGMTAWDDAFTDLQAAFASLIGDQASEIKATAMEAFTEGQAATLLSDGDIERAWLMRWDPTVNSNPPGTMGWATAAISSGAQGVFRTRGIVTGLSGLTPGARYYPDSASPGDWTTTAPTGTPTVISGVALDATTINVYLFTTSAFLPGAFPADLFDSRLELVLMTGGIDPLGKTDASTLDSGDGCWQDQPGQDFWAVVDTDYAPIFNNINTYLSRPSQTNGKYYSTKELGLRINIECPERLLYGDEIQITIGNAGWGTTYNVNDKLTLPVIAAAPLYLTGGQDGSSIQTWSVSGDVTGPLPNYSFNPASPAAYAYSSGGNTLAFLLAPAGIPFAKGDTFKFTLEGGHYSWRKNGGSWSSTIAIPVGAVSVELGLSVEFKTGSAPSFVAGDVFSFQQLQPWAVSNIQAPTLAVWKWDEASATPSLVIDLGSAQSIPDVALALHSLPDTATITLEGGTVSGTYTWTETLLWQEGVIAKEFAAPQTARYLRLSFTGAAGGSIGWAWAGDPVKTERSADILLRDSYNMKRGDSGLFQNALYLGQSVSGEVTWTEGVLTDDDRTAIRNFVKYMKQGNDQPFIIMPQVERPDEAYLVRAVADEAEFDDVTKYNANVGVERLFSARLVLAGVWRS